MIQLIVQDKRVAMEIQYLVRVSLTVDSSIIRRTKEKLKQEKYTEQSMGCLLR